MISVIQPSAIAAGEAQQVSADLTKFDVAGSQVNLTVAELDKYKLIPDKATCDAAMLTLKQANEVSKAIETKRTELVKPFNDSVKKINEYAKGLISRITTGIDTVKKAALAFQEAEEKKAAELKRKGRIIQLESLGLQFDEMTECYTGYNVTIHKIDLSLPDIHWDTRIEAAKNKIAEHLAQETKTLEADKELVDFFGSDEHKAALEEKAEEMRGLAASLLNGAHTMPAVAEPERLKGITLKWVFEITDKSLVPREYLIVDETAVRRAVNLGERSIPGVKIYQEKSLSIR